jgi:small-conductance mechanosensitive channel
VFYNFFRIGGHPFGYWLYKIKIRGLFKCAENHIGEGFILFSFNLNKIYLKEFPEPISMLYVKWGNYKKMKPYLINLLNALILIILGSWAYFTSENPSVTALIPVFAGGILLAVTPGFKKGNSILAHVAVTLTLLMLLGLLKPLTGAIGRADSLGIIRVLVMMASSVFAMIVFVKSFIDVRRNAKKD